MADQAQALLNQYLPDTDDDEIKWLRASSYPEIHLQLPADQWNEQNADNQTVTFAPEDIRWNTAETTGAAIQAACEQQTANHAICQELGDDIETALETLAGEQGETLAAEQKDQLIDQYESQHTQPLVEQRDLFIGLNPEDAKALQAAATPSQQPQHPVRLHQATGYTEALNAQEHDEHQDGYGAFLPQEAWDSYQQNQQTAWEEWATVWRDKQQTDAPSRWIPSFNTKTHIINCTGGKDTTQNEGKTGCQSNNGNNICLLYTSPSPRDLSTSRMPSSA